MPDRSLALNNKSNALQKMRRAGPGFLPWPAEPGSCILLPFVSVPILDLNHLMSSGSCDQESNASGSDKGGRGGQEHQEHAGTDASTRERKGPAQVLCARNVICVNDTPSPANTRVDRALHRDTGNGPSNVMGRSVPYCPDVFSLCRN